MAAANVATKAAEGVGGGASIQRVLVGLGGGGIGRAGG